MAQDQPNRLDRIEATLATHNEVLTELAPLTAVIAQLLERTASRVDQHDQALTRIEEQTRQNS